MRDCQVRFALLLLRVSALVVMVGQLGGVHAQTAELSPAERNLLQAQQEWQAEPNNPDKLIWVGRRLGYLGRFEEAIASFSQGVDQYPNDPRFLRHRGHRYISTRQFELAERDLHKAATMIAGQTDSVEPDGQPNAAGIPTSTLHTNIWYHLGLAYFLQGKFTEARDAYEHCLAASTHDDMRVATLDWLYMTLRRLGQDELAAKCVAEIRSDMTIVENHAYHRRILMYRGLLNPDQLLGGPTATSDDADKSQREIELATNGFGVGHWYLLHGDINKAREVFQAVVKSNSKSAFGVIAAEVELRRLSER